MLADEAAETEDEVLAREKAALERCFKRLTPAHRELVLAPNAGCGRVKELAEQTERSVNSLYKLLGRLRAKLQGCIDQDLSRHVGMARSSDPDSANSQFFIMFAPGDFLNGQYTVVGKVISGMEVVDQIKRGDGANGEVTEPDVMAKVTVQE